MTERILTEMTASISELKAHPMQIIAGDASEPVAILNRNKPAFYCLSPALYEAMMEAVDDMALLRTIDKRKAEKAIAVTLDDL